MIARKLLKKIRTRDEETGSWWLVTAHKLKRMDEARAALREAINIMFRDREVEGKASLSFGQSIEEFEECKHFMGLMGYDIETLTSFQIRVRIQGYNYPPEPEPKASLLDYYSSDKHESGSSPWIRQEDIGCEHFSMRGNHDWIMSSVVSRDVVSFCRCCRVRRY